MSADPVARHLAALQAAHECFRHGARPSVVALITGLSDGEIHSHFVRYGVVKLAHGRVETASRYIKNSTRNRLHASVFLCQFQSLLDLGWEARDALLTAYRRYREMVNRPDMTFSTAFAAASHMGALWGIETPGIALVSCRTCGLMTCFFTEEQRRCPLCTVARGKRAARSIFDSGRRSATVTPLEVRQSRNGL